MLSESVVLATNSGLARSTGTKEFAMILLPEMIFSKVLLTIATIFGDTLGKINRYGKKSVIAEVPRLVARNRYVS
jgi:hypothetical protein